MLVDICKDGKTLLQILDTPGEIVNIYEKDKEVRYPTYFHDFTSIPNPKIFLILLEPYWRDQESRSIYSDRIRELKRFGRKTDRFIFLFNKVDLTPLVRSFGKVEKKDCLNEILCYYPGSLVCWKNRNFLTKYIQKFTCGIVPFQTGTYAMSNNGLCIYSPGPIEYVTDLWKELTKSIK